MASRLTTAVPIREAGMAPRRTVGGGPAQRASEDVRQFSASYRPPWRDVMAFGRRVVVRHAAWPRRFWCLLAGVAVLAGVGTWLPSSAHAAAALCPPPRCVAGSLAFRSRDYRFNVMLPEQYGSSRIRFPVLYLMGGVGNDQDSWLKGSDLLSFTADQPVIVVTLDGDPTGLHIDYADGTFYWESFIVSRLLPYMDATYRTVAGRSGRAVAGLSAGAFGAVHLAARHPDDFVAVAGFSGAIYDIARPSPAAELFWSVFALTPPPVPNPSDPFPYEGDPLVDDIRWHNHNPVDLAKNLRATDIYLATGNGVPCHQQDASALIAQAPLSELEDLALQQTADLDQALTTEHVRHTADYYGCGIHSWAYWQRDLHSWWPRMLAVFGSAPPASFDYRTADPSFSVWGWAANADPTRAAEFLDAQNVSCRGLRLIGSGMITITTPSCFRPSSIVRIRGAVEATVTVSPAGTICFRVDLGHAHRLQEYSPEERVLQAMGSYFHTKVVTIE